MADKRIEQLRQEMDAATKARPHGELNESGLSLNFMDEIEPVTEAQDFVEGLFCEGQFSVIYGESNTGKTFFATDVAMHVALGWPWRGGEVQQGAVLYVAAEGGYGIKNRVAAFKEHHGITGRVPFVVVPESVDLLNPDGDADRITTAARQVEECTGFPVKMIVVDTLSRALAGGDENTSRDMGALVNNVDKLRWQTGAHICLVHHAGKDTSKGARGHSLLRAATDTEVEIVRPEEGGMAVANVRKQRELPCEGVFSFKLEPIELGRDHRGKPVTSCVVTHTDATATRKSGAKLTPDQKAFLDVVKSALADEGEHIQPMEGMPTVAAVRRDRLRDQLVSHGFVPYDIKRDQLRYRLQSYANKLKGRGVLGVSKEWVWLP